MKKKGKVALGRIVLTNREHVIKLKPLGKGLLGTTLRYPYELRDEEDYFKDIPNRACRRRWSISPRTSSTARPKFDPDKFEDKYETALKKLIKRKAAGKTIEVPEREEPAGKAGDLMEALRQSLGRRPTARWLRGASRRAAPRRRSRRRPRRHCAPDARSLARRRQPDGVSPLRRLGHAGVRCRDRSSPRWRTG